MKKISRSFIIIALLAVGSLLAQTAKTSTVIGTQTWDVKNLDVTTFANGDKIEQAQSDEEWVKAGNEMRAAWCYYENNTDNGKTYGLLYNWYAVGDPRGLAPKGWHVPTKAEWITLLDQAGGKNVAGTPLKGKSGWEAVGGTDRNGTDDYGFNALPGGLRSESNGKFNGKGTRCQYWTSTKNTSVNAAIIVLGVNPGVTVGGIAGNKFGYSVRCMKD
ncbi:hypothetical protein WSM22_36130 [Cytophagales bacterium WSM2-2]|nr:hypothetical protein WSM22_36130 [Cytophagales bacterium WSM2-2]